MKAGVTIAMVEDDPRVRERIATTLNARPGWRVVAKCSTSVEALREIPAARPDVILLDVVLGEESGTDLITPLKLAVPGVPVVMLTVVSRTDEMVRAIDAGAAGYILKMDASGLISDVEDILEGRSPTVSPSVARRLIEAARGRASPLLPEGTELSPREKEVLNLAARGKRLREIALLLGISVNTLKTHLRRVYEKMGTRSVLETVNKLRDTPANHAPPRDCR